MREEDVMRGVVGVVCCGFFFFFQAEDGIRDLVRSRGLGDVYKRQVFWFEKTIFAQEGNNPPVPFNTLHHWYNINFCIKNTGIGYRRCWILFQG